MEEEDPLLAQCKPKSAQYGDKLVVSENCFQKLVSNARAYFFSEMRDRITKQLAFYRRIIVDSCDLNASK